MAARSLVRGDRLAPGYAPAAAVAGGLLTAAAFPPYALRPLAVLGPALLLAAVYHQPPRRSALYGLGYGLAFFVPLLSWLQTGAGTNAWLILALLEAALVAVSAAGLALVTRLPGWPFWAAAVWVAQEAVRGRFPFGGFTWGRLGFSQDAGPLLHWAAVGGVPLVTYLVALAAGLLVVAVRRLAGVRRLFSAASPGLAAAALAVAVLPVAFAPLLPGPPRTTRTVTIAVVQGNVPRLGLASFDQRQQDQVIRNHVEATYALASDVEAGRLPRPAFVVWPENSTDRDPRHDATVGALISSAAGRVGVPVLVGAVLDRPHDQAENAGVVWDPVTGFGHTYVKRHLVPFGEYVPFRAALTPVFGRLAMVAHDFVPASSAAPLDVAGTKVGDVICFEVAYDGLVRDSVRDGAELLVVQTNNASFGRTAETSQQLAMSRVRAVEHGRSVLVAATSGISAVIAPDGSTVDESRVWTRDLLVHPVPLATGRTLASRAGAWPEWGLVLVAGVALSFAGTLRRR
jgi:apolipoprotein N-acyltransferase